MVVFFIGSLAPLAGSAPPPSDIFAARKAALLFVRGAILGGEATLRRAFGFTGVTLVAVTLSALPFSLLVETLSGFVSIPAAVLGREEAREIEGRAEPLVCREAADAGREGVRDALLGWLREVLEDERV